MNSWFHSVIWLFLCWFASILHHLHTISEISSPQPILLVRWSFRSFQLHVNQDTSNYPQGAGGTRREYNTGLILDTWKIGCTQPSVGGSLSRTTTGLKTLVIWYGPMNLGASLREGTLRDRSLVESHTLTTHVTGGRSLMLVGRCFGSSANSDQGLPVFLPGASTLLNGSQGRRNCSFRFLWGKQRGLESNRTLKWGQTYIWWWKGVVSVFDPRQLLAPGARIVGCQAAESMFQILVGLLGLPVGLRMDDQPPLAQCPWLIGPIWRNSPLPWEWRCCL